MTVCNKTIIIGRIEGEPVFDDKQEKCYFKITNKSIDENNNEKSDYYNVVAIKKQAKLIYDYLHNGDLCCVEGRFNREFLDKKEINIIAERITFLSARNKKSNNDCET